MSAGRASRSLIAATDNLVSGVDKIGQPEASILCDVLIRRFEVAFTFAWEAMRDHLSQKGVVCRNASGTIVSAKREGILDKASVWEKMLEDIETTSSLYTFEEGLTVCRHIEKQYIPALESLARKLLLTSNERRNHDD